MLMAKRACIKVDIESVAKGTAVVPATPVLAYDVTCDPTSEYIERRGPGGHIQGVRGAMSGKCSFKTHYRGSGTTTTADPGIAVLLQCCGWILAGGVYTPCRVVGSQKTATIYVYKDGMLKALVGAHGKCSLEAKPGGPLEMSWDFVGIWVDPSAVALPALSHTTVQPARFVSASLASGAAALQIGSLKVDLGNDPQNLPDANTASGIAYGYSPDCSPTITLDPLAVLEATHSFLANWKAGTTSAFTATIGTAANNKVTIAAPKLLYRDVPEGVRNEGVIYNLVGLCLANSDAGDDEITLTPG